jgi:lipoprotein NlpD
MCSFDRHVLITLVAVLGIAGCSTPAPAPVEHRTRPQAVVKPQPPTRAQSTSPIPASRTPAPSRPVQAAPVPSRGVQVRPLGATTPGQQATPENLRNEPRGEKLAYSDQAVAEMRRSPSPIAAPAPAQAPVAPVAPAAPAAQASVSPDPKTASAATASSAGVSAAGFSWPASGSILKPFSEPSYMGVSIAGTPGDPINAAADGKVIFSGVGPRGYGNLIIVRHDADTLSVYAHNRALLVKDGDQVQRGQKIAELGDSGADRPKLHFEIRKAGKPVDPTKLLPAR